MINQPNKPINLNEIAEKTAPLLKLFMEEMQMPMYHDRNNVIALDRMQKYKAHIRAWFTESQALELCKA